jgi:hypothetical protein
MMINKVPKTKNVRFSSKNRNKFKELYMANYKKLNQKYQNYKELRNKF